MTPNDIRDMLSQIYDRYRGARYTRSEVLALSDTLAPLTSDEATVVESRVLRDKDFLPNLQRWKEEADRVLRDRRRKHRGIEAPMSRPDCPGCGGVGIAVTHLLSLKDHRYLGPWSVRCPQGCPSPISGVPSGPDAVVEFLRRPRTILESSHRLHGEHAIAFPTVEALEAWRDDHPESLGRQVARVSR